MKEPRIGDQLSGPYGPKFVGYGKPEKQPLGDYLRYGLWIAVMALGIMAFAGVWP